MGRQVASRPDKYVSLDLTFIGCIETSAMYMSGVMKCIGDDTNVSEMMQVIRPLGLKLKLR